MVDHPLLVDQLAEVGAERHLGGAQKRLLVAHLGGVGPPGQLGGRSGATALELPEDLFFARQAVLAVLPHLPGGVRDGVPVAGEEQARLERGYGYRNLKSSAED